MGNAYWAISLLLDLFQVWFAYAVWFSYSVLLLHLIVSERATNIWSLSLHNELFLPCPGLLWISCVKYNAMITFVENIKREAKTHHFNFETFETILFKYFILYP